MHRRTFGRTGWQVSEIGFGAWAIGGSWGEVSDRDAEAALNAALDEGVTFLDTADVYGGGRSEQLIARVLGERGRGEVIVATKAGRKLNPHVAEAYTPGAIEGFIDASRRKLAMDTLDLVQLHCPPTAVYEDAELFGSLDRLVEAGKLRAYGVSVETIAEAMRALDYPIASIQIIFNLFRQRPAEAFFQAAKAKGVGIIARVPLASGMLSGRITADTTFAADDHRQFNRNGEAFDVGETFSGVPFDAGLEAVEELRGVTGGAPMAAFALRWILMFDAVTVAIPGARNAAQAASNAAAADLPDLPPEAMAAARDTYDRLIRPHVHGRW